MSEKIEIKTHSDISPIINNHVNMNNTQEISDDWLKGFIFGYRPIIGDANIDYDEIYKYISKTILDKMTLSDLYNYVADYCASKASTHYDYNTLASRILVDRLHSSTNEDMLEVVKELHSNKNSKGESNPLVSKHLYNVVKRHHKRICDKIDHSRDYLFDYFGIRTLERSYLLKVHDHTGSDKGKKMKKRIIERPQHLIMRVALGIHGSHLSTAFETYDLISERYFTHATPTLFNCGTNRPQLSSCFLLGMDDNLENMYDQVKQMALISKWAGGIGVHMHDIRPHGSIIRGTNGISEGIIPLTIVANKVGRHVNQGGKRSGSIAVYLEVHHGDIFEFCELRKQNSGTDDTRARDLFLALWICDLFMKRVENDEMWSLMCPDTCPNLTNTFGKEFEELYESYEKQGMYIKRVKARTLWNHILECQIETGFPYMLYKDNANEKSNQKNLGTIKSSNLCVHGDTKILTDNGNKKISNLENQQVNIWNGEEWSEVTVKKTGTNKNLIRVTLTNGLFLDCTEEHKFYVYDENDNIVEKSAKDLLNGDKLEKTKKYPICDDMYKNFKLIAIYTVLNYNKSSLKNNNIEFTMNKEEWIDTKLLLNTLGVDCTIDIIKEHRYSDEDLFVVRIHVSSYKKLINLGMKELDKIKINLSEIEDKDYIYDLFVDRVEKSFENCDTYCFTEHKRHRGVFNGILTGQCAEIIEYSDGDETAVCNLASICLPRYVRQDSGITYFDYDKLEQVTRVITRNLNRIIDINYYPTNSTKKSNKKHRPIGIGVQGLADVYCLFSLSYESEEANILNKKIFETIYYASVDESKELAKLEGAYESFKDSPFSNGKLQYHLWGLTEKDLLTKDKYDWNTLREEVRTYGTRNSLLTALMPTASTSQIMKCYESFEPYMSNVFVRTTLAGEFIVINEHLMKDLIKKNLWSDDMRKKIIIHQGSIQNINEIPQNIKDIYKTAFELNLKNIIAQSVNRGPFIDQSQSMNLFMKTPDFHVLTNAHFYGWRNGLKTGMYYLRSTPAINPIQFGIDISDIIRITGKASALDLILEECGVVPEKSEESKPIMCKYIPGKSAEGCLTCSS